MRRTSRWTHLGRGGGQHGQAVEGCRTKKGRAFLTGSELAVACQEGVPESKVAELGITLEDGDDADEEDGGEEGLVRERDRERGDVGEHVQLEHADKEGPEVVKHFDEEVPP